MSFPEWLTGQANPEVPVNEGFDILEYAAVYGRDPDTTTGLTWGYLGGRWSGFSISAGTLTLTNSATNYVVVLRSTGAISVSTSSTNWNNTSAYARVYQLTTAGGLVTATQDHRAGDGGIFGSSASQSIFTSVPIVPLSSSDNDYTADPADAGKLYRFTGAGAKTLTIDTDWAADQIFHVANRAASGNLTLIEGSSTVTLNPPKGGTLILEPGDTVSVHFVSSLEADVFGSTGLA